jgi:transposase
MRYVGLDVHQNRSSLCILDSNGKRVKEFEVRGGWDKLLEAIKEIAKDGPFAICYEASCGYGVLYERLSKLAAVVKVAHPGRLRLIFKSKRKNDRVDARKLATLLFLDQVPAVHVPSVDVRSWRAMIEHRHKIMQKRVATKNQIKGLLRGQGLRPPAELKLKGAKGLWTKKGLAWVATVEFPTSFDGVRRDMLLEELAEDQRRLARVEEELEKVADANPAVTLLRTIPGVGIRTAEAVAAYVDDPTRFGKLKTVGAYFGLVPCQDASADKNRLGHITREGPATVRKLVTEAAWQAVRRCDEARAFFERVMDGDAGRRKIALVATAHWLLRVMLSMLKSGEVCRFQSKAQPDRKAA